MAARMQGKRAVVVGGGISGLAACHYLEREARARGLGARIILLEASPRLGGVIRSERAGDFLLENGPDCFISSKPEALAIAEELGVAGECAGTRARHRRSFILHKGRLVPVPEGFYLLAPVSLGALVKAPLFSLAGKARMAMDLLIPRRKESGDETLASFVRRRLGAEALARFAQPMAAGIYAAGPETLGMEATFPQFLEMERRFGSVIRGLAHQSRRGGAPGQAQMGAASGPRYSLFVSFRGGMSTITEALSRSLRERLGPEALRTGAGVKALGRSGGLWRLALEDGGTMEADAIVLALPAPKAAAFLAEAEPGLSEKMRRIAYGGCAVLNFVFRREQVAHPMNGMGFVVPAVEGRSLLGCSFSHEKFEGRAPEGFAVLRVFVGEGAAASASEAELQNRVLADLREILGIRGEPLLTRQAHYAAAMPRYGVGHAALVREMEARLPAGLALAGNAYAGIGIPDCVRSGRLAAERLISFP
jgi:oxygen-dependent protoporphyrinogen oxidase